MNLIGQTIFKVAFLFKYCLTNQISDPIKSVSKYSNRQNTMKQGRISIVPLISIAIISISIIAVIIIKIFFSKSFSLFGIGNNNESDFFSSLNNLQDPFVYIPREFIRFHNLSSDSSQIMNNYAQFKLNQNFDAQDYSEFGLRARLFAKLFKKQLEKPCGCSVYTFLEKQLFGNWLGSISVLDLYHQSIRKDSGIVIAVGNKYVKFACHTIKVIREIYKSSIPIEIFYNGIEDLRSDAIEMFDSMPMVKTVNLKTFVSINDLAEWDIKPFAILFSSFRNVILMDADAIFMQNPEILFGEEGYQRSGTLFFHDRTLFSGDFEKSRWISRVIPEPHSPSLRMNRLFLGQSSHEQEAGVVIIDKSRHFIGILTVCSLNLPKSKEQIRLETHGEKETFWIAMELVEESYEFLPNKPGSIGQTFLGDNKHEGKQMVCGHLAHFDRKGDLLWFNDGIVANKRDPEWENDLADLQYISKEGEWTPYLCIYGNVTILTLEQLSRIEEIKRLYDPEPVNTFVNRRLNVRVN